MANPNSSPSSIFPKSTTRLPDDTVFFSIFPDSSPTTSNLQSLHLQILNSISPITSNYIWQHEPFTLSVSDTPLPNLHGKVRFGDNLNDEWFVVFILFEISRIHPDVSIRVWDTDGEFLLIEAAFHLPRWLNPDNSENRVFIRNGNLHIIPNSQFQSNPSLFDALSCLIKNHDKFIALESVQSAIKAKIGDYPGRIRKDMHRVRVRVPVAVANVLKHEPCFISLAVEGFYDRDIDSMKFAGKMERFLPNGSGEEIVEVSVLMSRAMYAQLVQQTFQAPKCYPMPVRGEGNGYVEAELGMKIACGFEMIYQLRKRDGLQGKGSTWDAFKESLENSGYFEGLLPGSKEYKRLTENAEEYYKKSSSHSRASEMMSAPVTRIDEILALPYSSDDLRGQDLPPSDDDQWLYNGEDELNSALLERQKEMELYDSKHKKKQKSKEHQDAGPSSSDPNLDENGLSEIAKSMQAFVKKMSSYEGAEIPQNRDEESVDFDVDRFMKEMESAMGGGRNSVEEASDADDIEEGSSSDMDFDESEGEDDEDEDEVFMSSYSDALSKELKTTTLDNSFVRVNEQIPKKDEASVKMDEDEEFNPVDVDMNLVKSLLDSFSSQEGLPGPASNLLGLMGLDLPQDSAKHKK